MNRKIASTCQVGASTQPSVPRAKIVASIRMLCRRPYRSDSRPPISAPNAAPKIRMLTTKPSVNAVRPRSSFIGASAPLMTPVSYPNSRPPKVATTAISPSRRECGPGTSAGKVGWCSPEVLVDCVMAYLPFRY